MRIPNFGVQSEVLITLDVRGWTGLNVGDLLGSQTGREDAQHFTL